MTFKRLTLLVVPTLLTLAFASSANATIFRIDATRVRGTAFQSRDVPRLSKPANCDDAVLESVLQEMYSINPNLQHDDAASAVKDLKRIGKGSCRSRASSNEAILTFLRRLNERRPDGIAGRAVLDVTRDALADDLSDSGVNGGDGLRRLTASKDSFATLSSESFDPPSLLSTSFTLAQANHQFGLARDQLWEGETGASIYSSTATLLDDPAFAGAGPLTSLIQPDGSLQFDNSITSQVLRHQFSLMNAQTDAAQSDVDKVEEAKKKHDAEIEAIKKQVKEDAGQREEILDNVDTSFQFAVLVVGTFDKKTADDLEQVGKVVMKGARLFNKMADTAGSLTVNIATGNVFGVMKDLLGVATELGPIFGGAEPKSPEDLVQEQLGALAKDMADFRADVDERFDHVDKQLNQIATQLSVAFQAIDQKFRDLDRNVKGVFDQLTTLRASLSTTERRLYEAIKGSADVDLWSDINTAIGWRDRSVGHAPMSNADFLKYEGKFHTWGTTGATGFALVPDPRHYDADSLADELDNPIERNVEFFSQFARNGLGFSGPLGPHKLANPRDWAVAARAESALLLENPEYATPGLAERVSELEDVGRDLRDAFARLSARDTADGTHNSVLNEALAYYRRYATDAGTGMAGALKAEEDDFLAHAVAGEPLGLDLWGGADQEPQGAAPSSATMPHCGATDPQIAALSAPLMRELVPNAALAAGKLRLGDSALCWTASWSDKGISIGSTDPDDELPTRFEQWRFNARLNVTVRSTYAGNPLRSRTITLGSETYCTESHDKTTGQRVSGACPSNPPDAAGTTASRWATLRATFESGSALTDAGALPGIRAAVTADLSTKQKALYARVLDSFEHKGLRAVAGRLTGAERLVDGYLSLGLPRALEYDDELHALLRGPDALLDEGPDGRISSRYADAFDDLPAENPRLKIQQELTDRPAAMEKAIERNLPSSGSGTGGLNALATGDNGTSEPETIPLVETTLARLELTRAIVASGSGPVDPPVDPGNPTNPPVEPPGPVVPGRRDGDVKPQPLIPTLALTFPRQRLGTALAKGLRLTVASSGPGSATIELVLPGAKKKKPVVVGRGNVVFKAAGKKAVVVKFSAQGKKLLRRAKKTTLTVRSTIKGQTGSATSERRLSLKR